MGWRRVGGGFGLGLGVDRWTPHMVEGTLGGEVRCGVGSPLRSGVRRVNKFLTAYALYATDTAELYVTRQINHADNTSALSCAHLCNKPNA